MNCLVYEFICEIDQISLFLWRKSCGFELNRIKFQKVFWSNFSLPKQSKKSFKNISEDLGKIPRTSGVYYFYDKDDNIYYVGKAKILRSRIRDHRNNNDAIREGKFFRNMLQKNLPPESKQKLEQAMKEFEFRGMYMMRVVAVDWVFDKVSRIDIEEMPHELTEKRETDMICKLIPIYNSETGSDEYYDIMEGK